MIDLERTKPTDGDEKNALLMHLGMTGQIVVTAAEAPVPPHTHMFIALDDGRELRYTDIRRFGRIRILLDGEREALLGRLGLDPLEMGRRIFGKRLQAERADQGAVDGPARASRDGEHLYG